MDFLFLKLNNLTRYVYSLQFLHNFQILSIVFDPSNHSQNHSNRSLLGRDAL